MIYTIYRSSLYSIYIYIDIRDNKIHIYTKYRLYRYERYMEDFSCFYINTELVFIIIILSFLIEIRKI